MTGNSTIAGYITIPYTIADRLDQTFVLDTSRFPTANLLDDDDLFDFFHDYVVGITGLTGDMVFPRWQESPPNIPDFGVNWCGVGVHEYHADPFIAEVQGTSTVEFRRHEVMSCLASFYGTNAGAYARLFRDGMQLSQNHEQLNINNMGFVDSDEVQYVPALIKERWTRRADLRFRIKRQVIRTYPVFSITESDIILNNEKYTETIIAR